MFLAETALTPAQELAEVWKFNLHLEVWVLALGVLAAYVYMVRVIGPTAVPEGPVVTGKQKACFVLAVLVFWGASDWPVHDLAEQYLRRHIATQ